MSDRQLGIDERFLTRLAEAKDDTSGWWGSWLTFFYGLMVGLNAKKVLEIGVWKGGSTKAMLMALQRMGGHLWSIDIEDRSQWIPESLRTNWTQIICPSEHVTPTFHQDWPDAHPLDALVIDAVHTYEHVMRELKDLDPLVRFGGVIVLDDVSPAMFPGVSQAFEEWTNERRGYTYFRVPYGHKLTQPGGEAREAGIIVKRNCFAPTR